MTAKNKIAKYSLLNALGAAAYVAIVATFMSNAEILFGDVEGPFAPMGFLMLFVLSAAVMGTLVFGRPILWYLDGKKKEAVTLLLYTLGFLAIITLTTLLSLLL